MVGWFVAMPFFAVFDVPVINDTWVPPLWFGILCLPLGILVFFVALHLLNAWSWVCARWAEVMFRGPAQAPATRAAPAPPAVPAPLRRPRCRDGSGALPPVPACRRPRRRRRHRRRAARAARAAAAPALQPPAAPSDDETAS